MTGDESGEPSRGAVVAALPALVVAAAATVATAGLAAAADLRDGALAGGIVLLAALAGGALAVRRGAPPLAAGRLAALPVLALVALAAALAGAAALPDDLHLRTVGRPPAFLLPLAIGLGAALLASFAIVRRGAPPARAGLVLLLPLLTLEGLPIGAPPALGLALAGALVLLGAGERRGRTPGALAIAAFLAALAVSTFLGADPGPGVDVLTRLLALAGAFWVVATDDDPKASARVAVRTLLVTVAAVAVAGLVSRLLLDRTVSPLGIDAFGTELSLFGRHPNTLAPWFGAGAVLALPLVLSGRGVDRALGALVLPLAAAALFLTASRLSIGATFAAVVLISIRRTRLARALVRVGAALAVVALAAFVLPAFRDKIANRAHHPNVLLESHRLHRMEIAWRTAADRPWLGHGPRTWFVQGRFVPPSRFEGESSSDHPHDLPLALLEGSGALGLALFLVLLAVGLGFARRALAAEDAEVRMLATGVSFALVAQLLTNLLDMGDALDTFVPSRLLVDLGILAALARAAGRAPAGLPIPRPVVALGGLLLGAAGVAGTAAAAFAAHGEALAARGEPARAIVAFERAATLRPFDADVRLAIVPLAWSTGEPGLARERLREAEEIAPDRPALQRTRAMFLRVLSGDRPALDALERVAELDPRGAIGTRLAAPLAELRLATGDRDGGLEAAATALWEAPATGAAWIDPARPDVLSIAGVDVPLAEVRAALAARVPEGAAHRLARRLPLREAELFLLLGRTEDAYAALARLEEMDGAASSHQLQFEARVARAAGDLDRSREAAERALADRAHPSLELELGETLSAAGRHEEALAAYRRALALSLDAHFVEGIYHDLLVRLAAELDALDRPAERAVALEQLAFFSPDPLERAETTARLAAARREAGAAPSAVASALRHALRLLLVAGVSDSARALAADLGARLARARPEEASPSRYADDLERLAERRGGGPVLHTFRVALLNELGLAERAAAAARDLAATR